MSKAWITFLLLTITASIKTYGQLAGKWKTTTETIFNNPAETIPLDSVIITFKKNGQYTMDLYSIEAFPFHEQPWKNYFSGEWMLNANKDSLTCYHNIEFWIHKTERQDFLFHIKQINENELTLEGYGKEKRDKDNDILFAQTPVFQLILTKEE